MLDRATATANLTQLYRCGGMLEELEAVDDTRLAVVMSRPLTDEQKNRILKVIKDTFCHAAKLESTRLPLRVKVSETPLRWTLVSPGTVLAALPQELQADIKASSLPCKEVDHERGVVECWGAIIPIDIEVICGISPPLQELFDAASKSTLPRRIEVDCSVPILKSVIDWLHGVAPLPSFDCTDGVLEVAKLLAISPFNTALAKQWQREDHLINASLLLNKSPEILLLVLQSLEKNKRLEILGRLINEPEDQESQTSDLSPLENCLTQLINSQIILFSDLINLLGDIGKIYDRFTPNFFTGVKVLHLIQSPTIAHGAIHNLLLHCPNLRVFAPPTSITNQGLTSLTKLLQLQVLDLGDCRFISSGYLTNIRGPKLSRLSVRGCSQLTSFIPREIAENLRFLNLTGCHLLATNWSLLARCNKLEVLSIGDMNVTGCDSKLFAGFPQLETLDLSHSKLPPRFLSLLRHTPNLFYLNLEGCSGLTANCWGDIASAQGLPLTHLNIGQHHDLPPNIWECLMPFAQTLQYLGVADCDTLPPGFEHFLKQCQSLKWLAIQPGQIQDHHQIPQSVKQLQRWPDDLRKRLFQLPSQQMND